MTDPKIIRGREFEQPLILQMLDQHAKNTEQHRAEINNACNSLIELLSDIQKVQP